ncbi:hypothetical protein Trydic_g21485 [Trypoxylus dichotomus]
MVGGNTKRNLTPPVFEEGDADYGELLGFCISIAPRGSRQGVLVTSDTSEIAAVCGCAGGMGNRDGDDGEKGSPVVM